MLPRDRGGYEGWDDRRSCPPSSPVLIAVDADADADADAGGVHRRVLPR